MTSSNKIILWEILVSYMEEHPDLAKGHFSGPTGKENQKKLWTELGSILDSQGFGKKTIQKWQKTWSDFKYNLKKKAAALNLDQNGTGGGPSQGVPLSEVEERCLSILGQTFAYGSGVQELGLDKIPVVEDLGDDATGKKRVREISIENTPYLPMPSSSTSQDHIYYKTPQKKARRGTIGEEVELCVETLNVLKEIKNTMASGFEAINKSLVAINNSLKPKNCNCCKQ